MPRILPRTPSANISTLNITEEGPLCSPTFGTHFHIPSCLDAISQIPNTDLPITFGEEILLQEPYRYSSSDGLCVVHLEPPPTAGIFSTRIRGTQARGIASTILEQCVVARGIGGVTYVTDRLGGSIRLQSYQPRVTCIDGRIHRPPENCHPTVQLLSRFGYMSSNQGVKFFSEDITPGPSSVRLPKAFRAETAEERPSRCVVQIDAAQRTEAHWQEIWEAAVAAEAMCVRQRRMGWATGIGRDGTIQVTVAYPQFWVDVS